MNPITIFRGTSGLNTVDDPARIPMAKNGLSDVVEIVNMRIEKSGGRPSKRPGFTLIQSGNFHSLFHTGKDCFVVQTRTNDDAIMRLNADSSLTGVVSGLSKAHRMAWCQHGEKTYFSNGVQRGVIQEGIAQDWVVGEYFGPDTNRRFAVPEYITHLEIHSGRMYVSVGPVLYWSEQHRFDLFDMGGSEFHGAYIQFHHNINMIRSVAGGLFIGTEKQTYFLVGNSPKDFVLQRVANSPPVEWSDAMTKIDGGEIGFDPGLCVLWASHVGAILGLPAGLIVNLTKEKIIYPKNVTQGFGCLVGYEFLHGMR